MAGAFDAIYEEFADELRTLEALLDAFGKRGAAAGKTRIAAANSATLLLSATLEEFVRELAREHARRAVARAKTIDKISHKLLSAAWRRNVQAIARNDSNADESGDFTLEAHRKFMAIYEFRRGDLSQDIYNDLITNQNNMNVDEINGLFSLSGKKNITKSCCNGADFRGWLGAATVDEALRDLRERIEGYFRRRNQIAHSLALSKSLAPDLIRNDIELLRQFGKALASSSGT